MSTEDERTVIDALKDDFQNAIDNGYSFTEITCEEAATDLMDCIDRWADWELAALAADVVRSHAASTRTRTTSAAKRTCAPTAANRPWKHRGRDCYDKS